MIQTLTQNFPNSAGKVSALVTEHRKLKDEPLLIAMYYAPDREPNDIFVLEIIEGFGSDSVDSDQRLFEVTYESTVAFPMEVGQKLHLLLTNRKEAEIAFRENWIEAAEVRQAVEQNRYQIIYENPAAVDLTEIIRGK